MRYVLDGGALLHRVPWFKNESYSTIMDRYHKYVSSKYPEAVIVFDGYESGPSPKDMVHLRRNKLPGREVVFAKDMILTTRKEEVLSNTSNKVHFIQILIKYLEEKRIKCLQAKEDADVLIVQTAVKSASSCDTVLIGEDTDLLVLLLYHADPKGKNLYFTSEPKKGKDQKIWDIKAVQECLGQGVCRRLLFGHAILGCDTTSRLNGLGKGLGLKKLLANDEDFNNACDVFLSNESSADAILEAGCIALVKLYGGKTNDDLDIHRYRMFQKKVSTAKAFINPQDLPPTKAAAKFHIYRVYFQVNTWIGSSRNLSSLDWGWKVREGVLVPIMTDIEPAPSNILKIIKCGCQGTCSSLRCSCKKNWIECSAACKNCKGVSC